MSYREDVELIQGALDRTIDEGDFEQLEVRLAAEPELRQLYYKFCQLHHGLNEEFEGVCGLPDRFRALEQAPVSRRVLINTALATAAIVIAMAVAAYFITISQPGPPALVSFGPMSSGQLPQGQVGSQDTSMAIGSRLTLDRGTAEIRLPSGVRALVEGPATVLATGRNELFLPSGRAWFEVPKGAEGFTCRTESIKVVDLGTQFGVFAGPEGHSEVHVQSGRVRAWPLKRPGEAIELTAGQGAVWTGADFEDPKDKVAFVSELPHLEVVLRDDFSEEDRTPLRSKLPDIGSGPWEVTIGDPQVFQQQIDTSGTPVEAFAPLPGHMLNERDHILIVTAEVVEPDSRLFHSEGWAGISLFTGDEERIFMGDPFGPGVSWALHPFGSNVVMPSPPLQGKRTVSLRYDYRNGLAELFEGWNCQGQAVASEWIPAGLHFNRLRVGNGKGGDLALRRIEVRVLTSAPAH